MNEFLKELTNPESIITYGGMALLLFIVFAETGLFVGFFLPGDSLIFVSGMICVSKPYMLNVTLGELIIFLSAAAILGNVVGYWFGYKVGPNLFKRDDSFFFKKKHVQTTANYYTKHGGKTLVIGRFLPIIRTFAPIIAGVVKMNFSEFMLYNIIGALAWIASLSSIGFYLGTNKWVQENVGYVILGLIIVTIIPVALGVRKPKK